MDAAAGAHEPGLAAPEAVTGDPRVDEAIGRLDELPDLPVTEHPAVYEHVHQRLAEALGDLDAREGAAPGGPDGAAAPGRAH